MPVHLTKNFRRSRRSSTEEAYDIERKRTRGELSCAECHRLKVKCDKNLPCGSCKRRGCESICPSGVLSAGQGTRYVLADTEQLHIKIYEMSKRIRQLEDALAFLQSTVSDETHPLLTDDMLRVKFGSETFNAPRIANDVSNLDGSVTSGSTVTEKSIDALGTLTVGSSGDGNYFGRSAGSEALMLRAGDDADDAEDESRTATEVDDSQFSGPFLFPFSSKSRLNLHELQFLEKSFPLLDRASQLCKLYLGHAAYFFRPVKNDELLGELLPSVYNDIVSHEHPSANDAIYIGYTQSLATLFFIFALGSLLDLTLSPYNTDSEMYYELGRASLSFHPFYNSPNLESVRAVGLMATYHSFAARKYTRDSAWSLMSIAAKAAQSIGLHRDSSKWNLDPKLVQRRRNLFWEVFSADLSHSLALGRPPAIHPSYVDCEFPQDDDAPLSGVMEHEVGLWRMKHIFARDIYSSVAEVTLIAKSPRYTAVMDLDKRVNGMSCPKSFNPLVTVEEVGEEMFHSSSLALRDFYASQNKSVTMLYLHRSFFAQTMLDHPDNPLSSPFALSFLAACRSSSIIIKAAENLFRRCAPIASRVWFLMYHMLSAAVILGTVVARSPSFNSAPMAMRDFEIAFCIFNEAAGHNQRAKIAWGILKKLRDKFRPAFEAAQSDNPLSNSSSSDVQEDDIVAIFGGQMSLLDRRAKQQAPSHPSSESMSPKKTAPTSALDVDFGIDGLPDVHPSLVEYLKQDAVRRAINIKHESTFTDQSLVASDRIASTPNVNSGGLHFPELIVLPGPGSESGPLSYLTQNSNFAATIPQPVSHDEKQQSLGGSELTREATSNTYPSTPSSVGSFDFDYTNNSRDPHSGVSSPFDPGLAEIGSLNGMFTQEDWFSFMRDCGIMDIESDYA